MRKFLMTAAAVAALAACSSGTEPADENSPAEVAAPAADPVGGTGPIAGTPAVDDSDPVQSPGEDDGDSETPPANDTDEENGADASSPAVIPAQYRGRWGLVPGDCTSTRGDAKGLMIIRKNKIRFYESTATLEEQRPAIATSFSGSYAFTGEGQSWERVVTLTRTGNSLTRAQSDGTFTYRHC